MTEGAGERKEAIGAGAMKATVIMGETEMTDGDVARDVEVDVDEGLDETVTLVFTCASLMCLCMRFFDENSSPHVLHSISSFMEDPSLSSLY